MIILVIAALLIFFFMRLYVRFKRWYVSSRIARNRDDYKIAQNYIIKTEQKLNRFQRWLLAQSGAIWEIGDGRSWFWTLLITIGFAIICFVLIEADIISIFMHKTFMIIGLLALLVIGFYWVDALKSLRQYARFLPFIFWSILMAVWIGLLII